MLKNQRYRPQTSVYTGYMKPFFVMSLLFGITGFMVNYEIGIPTCWKSKSCIIAGLNNREVLGADRPRTFIENTTESDTTASIPETDPVAASTTAPKQSAKVRIHRIIVETASRYEVDPAIIKAIIMAESSFNPRAESKRGARGLMQLMPRTAKYLGVQDSFDPSHNVDGGVRYFKRLMNRFDHNIELALAAYNAGSRNVIKYGGIPPFKETRRYVKKVLMYYEVYKEVSEGLGEEDSLFT